MLISDYGKIVHLDKLPNTYSGIVVSIEEKVDGSQFSFMRVPDKGIIFRSKTVEFFESPKDSRFLLAMVEIRKIEENLRYGWTYRGEFLDRPKHNSVPYDRVPARNFIGFDIHTPLGRLDYEEKRLEFSRLGIETVPELYFGFLKDAEVGKILERNRSILGGPIEGVVIKPAALGMGKSCIMAKVLHPAFSETKKPKSAKAKWEDIPFRIADNFATPIRYQKALNAAREAGEITGEPSRSDIGVIMKFFSRDLLHEEGEAMVDKLFNHYWKIISKRASAGIAEWYTRSIINKGAE